MKDIRQTECREQMNDELQMYEYWFAALSGISCRRKTELYGMHESAEAIYNIEETEIHAGRISPKEYDIIRKRREEDILKREYENIQKKGIHFCTILDQAYPEALRGIYSPPYAIFYTGKLPDAGAPSLAVVGARQCTYYGKTVAEEIGRMCGIHGVQLISGMARGIDGISQGSVLKAGGTSYAVLGCGVDICYPSEHRILYEQTREKGGILSEYPPGTAPLARNFPARNRIISALSDVLVVVEAREKSGSLITADFALEQGKGVYAVPGPVTSALSRGCNRLIGQGAEVFLSAEELMEDMQINTGLGKHKKEKIEIMLESRENLVYSCLDLVPRTVDEIQQKTQLEVSEIVAILTSLELKDYVEALSRNYYVRKEMR